MRKYVSALAFSLAATFYANDAFATMPVLTDTPSGKTVDACLKWASEQDEDGIAAIEPAGVGGR